MNRQNVQKHGSAGWNRRMPIVMAVATALIIVGCSLKPTELKYVQGVTQHTRYGQVEGTVSESTGTMAWRGIKFAKAPVGELRWKAPRAPEKWDGVREVKKTAPQCIQGFGFGEEDCLSLDIYRPASVESSLPVYVWIHGGANSAGNAPDLGLFAKGANLVVVAIRYRLGPLGFFKHDALKTGDPMDDSGNYGILDQIMALEWVKSNISSFGGNPDNVTIAGESAGAHDILALLTIERANGLYHKAIYQSGGMEYIGIPRAKEQSAGYIEKLKFTSTGAELAGELRTVEAKRLLKAKPAGARFGVIADGNLIKGNLACLVKKGKYNKVPILMGGNRNEYSAWLLWNRGPGQKWANLWSTVSKRSKKKVSDVLNEAERKTFALTSSITGRLWQAVQVHSVAASMRGYQDNIFVYDFQWGGTQGTDVDFVLGASHANEIGYFHYGGNWDWMGRGGTLTEENKAARHALAKAMMTYQAQFAHLGTPNGKADLPEWKVWSNEKNGVKTMNLDASSEPGSAELKLFMTQREYKQADLIRELDESGDEIARKYSRLVAKRYFKILECE
ncbi:MAG: carboxylesterase family protein [Proteobacteria bacterium]|nr:carboxylesterase family protein [Pseudomonadota bacterium]